MCIIGRYRHVLLIVGGCVCVWNRVYARSVEIHMGVCEEALSMCVYVCVCVCVCVCMCMCGRVLYPGFAQSPRTSVGPSN